LLLHSITYYLYVNFSVLPYFPRVLTCFSCFWYDHVSDDCKGKPRCVYCEHPKHPNSRYQNLPLLCCNCEGEHFSLSSKCPVYLRKQIYVADNVSYFKAKCSEFGIVPNFCSSLNPHNFNEFLSLFKPTYSLFILIKILTPPGYFGSHSGICLHSTC